MSLSAQQLLRYGFDDYEPVALAEPYGSQFTAALRVIKPHDLVMLRLLAPDDHNSRGPAEEKKRVRMRLISWPAEVPGRLVRWQDGNEATK